MCKWTNIALIGMPGAGKSTVGVLLAKQLGFAFVDTDIVIQAGEGKQLHQIIACSGLNRFLEIEERYVLSISGRNQVIATGGSVVYSQKAMQHLQELGGVIHLDLDLNSLQMRLGDLNARGVVREPGQNLAGLYRQRRPLYRTWAHRTIACAHLSPQAVADRIVDGLSCATSGS